MSVQNATNCGHPPTRTEEPEPLLTIQQVAEWLGVSTSTLYHQGASGDGPARIKFGNLIRYKRCCVTAWLDEHLVIRHVAESG